MISRLAKPLLAIAVVFAFVSCNTKTTSIKTLLSDPGKYDGQTVRISGQVLQSIGALGYGAYDVQDQTGTIPVVTQGGGAPARGTRVGVEGTFRAAYTLGTESRAVIVEKKRVSG
ncbi:MAG TPA: hypothetical protein VKQ05_03095 [Gemmatimonadales bacterium]|nr:hypothetical protein [Gemmatimonadales bacterium]